MHVARLAVRAHGQGGHGVQAQEDHVHEVFLGQALVAQVGVHQAQAAQPPGASAGLGQVRDEDAAGIAHDDPEGTSPAVDEQAQLAAHAVGEDGQFAGLVRGHAALRGIAAGVETDQGLDLAGLETLGVALDLGGYGSAPALAS